MRTTSKKYTKADRIADLIIALNEYRAKHGKIAVKRGWTGVAHWLMTDEQEYKSIGGMYLSDDAFIGFLEGMMIDN